MARQIVTQQAVNEAAEALISEGAEPSIVAVQSHIGGGSFSTVKRFLDVWKLERSNIAIAVPDTPPEVLKKGQEFAQHVWALASTEAQKEAKKAKDEAHAEVSAIRAELSQASAEITRLERLEAVQAETIDQHQARLRELELAMTEAQTQARRVPELEKSLAEIRLELDKSHKHATDSAIEAARLAGESESLRTQVRELMAMIKPQ